jgi:hypothetical protein
MEAINVLFSPAYYQYTMLTLSVVATIALSLPLMVAYIDHYYDKKDKQADFVIKPAPELEDVESSQQSEPSPVYEPRNHLITLRATQTEAEWILQMIPTSEYLTSLERDVGVNHRIVVYTERRRANSF